jgi:serine protease Do
MRTHPIFAPVILSLALALPAPAQSPDGGGPPPPTISTTSPRIQSAVNDFGKVRRPSHDWSLRDTPVVEAIRSVRDAVVNIHSERTAQGLSPEELSSVATSQNRINGMGSGIIIDPRGYIVTNQHVVEDVNVIRVRLADGTLASARVLARDQESDLALLKIDINRVLPVMPLGTAADLMVGETMIAIGNAYGYENSVTIGHVSATGRDVTLNKEVSYKSLIQTDAPINPGNSGGPLINIWGEMVGVNVAIRAGAQNIGFAIPVETMIRVTGNMLRTRGQGRGNPTAGATGLGLVVRDNLRLTHDETSGLRTVTVERIEANSAAAKAGLQRGDVLVKVGDVSLASTLDVERALVDGTPGDHIPVVLRRDGAEQKIEVVVEAVRGATPVSTDMVWRRIGLRLQTIAPEEIARTHPQLHGGLLVGDVRAEGAAAKAGIQRGDILVGLHQWEMLNLENVQFVLNHPDLASFSPLRFYILRAGQVHRGWLQTLD